MTVRIEFDKGIDGKMDKIGRAINRGLTFTLTDAAKFASDDLREELRTKVDRPAPFTLNKSGYGTVPARFGDATPSSEMFVKPAQSAYEQYVFSGGARGRGAAGASKKHVWQSGQPGRGVLIDGADDRADQGESVEPLAGRLRRSSA